MKNRPLLVVVMDGVGVNQDSFGNAVQMANTPYLNYLKKIGIYRELTAHGTKVGLPSDQDMGNSEVGHNIIGAGNVFAQGALLCENSLKSKNLFKGVHWVNLIKTIRESNGSLHLIGLLSDGNVHSHESHLYQLMERAVKDGINSIRIHPLLDGRDVGAKSAELYIERLHKKIVQLSSEKVDIKIASSGGRMSMTMDRYEADWSMVEKGWQAHVLGEAKYSFASIEEGLKFFRKDESLSDQFIPPFVISDEKGPVGTIQDWDGVIFFNFRGDRAIEISRAFEEENFDKFDRKRFPKCFYIGMMEYDGDLKIPSKSLVEPPEIKNTLSETLARKGVNQFACSETQKYGHVTFFWNGNKSGYFDKNIEEYIEIPSDIGQFHLKPWMKALEITEATIEAMKKKSFTCGRINYANGDMVGHTGDLEASILAVSTVDLMIGRLIEASDQLGYTLVITADHGNCDEMFEKNSNGKNLQEIFPKSLRPKPKTSHTLNPVPFYIYHPKGEKPFTFNTSIDGSLGNIAGTVYELLGFGKSSQYLPSLLK